MADVDQSRQWPGGMTQKIAVVQFRRTVAQVVQVEMGVKLHDERVAESAKFLVNRQDAQVVAADPEKELVGGQCLAGSRAGRVSPIPDRRQIDERKFLDADVRLIRPATSWPPFPPIVVEHFAECVGEQFRPRGGAGTAEIGKRADEGCGFHGDIVVYARPFGRRSRSSWTESVQYGVYLRRDWIGRL